MTARDLLLRLAFNGRTHRPSWYYSASIYRDCALLRDRLRIVF